MFDLEKFKSGKYFVHLPTPELYKEAMEFLKKNELSYVNKTWHDSQTCIRYEKHYGITKYANYDFYIDKGYELLELNEKEDNEVKAVVPLLKYATSTNNMVKSPNHYIGELGLEVEEVLRNFIPRYEDSYVAHRIASALEYLLRAPLKNGKQDLEKARYNIKQALDHLDDNDV